MTLNGKVAIVTGGGQGLGEATVHALAQAGATVVCADIQLEKAQRVAQALSDQGCAGSSVRLDVSSEDSVKEAVDAVMQRYGRIDILVNNAGVDHTLSIEELTVAQWDQVIQVNLRGPFLMSKYVLPLMYQQQGGHVVNIASTAAKRTWANASAYHASKWGLVGLSHALHVEARQHKVKVSTIVAGGMQTPFILERFPDVDPAKLQDPKNVAQTIVFVLSMPAESVIPEVMVLPMQETSWP
jgi:NAD(P)-dependent dehydrogenase (short-subunit alcohol dehydrogenase family)